LAKEHCKVQLHLSVAEETHDGFSLLPDRCFIEGLRVFAHLVTDLSPVTVVIRDPNDDMVVATAQRAQAAYIVTRDKDLLSLQHLSLSRLNHWLPRREAYPEVMQRTAECHHHIPDALLPQTDPVCE